MITPGRAEGTPELLSGRGLAGLLLTMLVRAELWRECYAILAVWRQYLKLGFLGRLACVQDGFAGRLQFTALFLIKSDLFCRFSPPFNA